MLPRSSFRDDPRLAHFRRQQPLPDGVVDFVRPGVQQIFALQVDSRTAELFREPRSKLQRRRASREILEQVLESYLKLAVRLRSFIGVLELEERHHQRFGNVAAAIRAKASRRRRWRL